MMRLLVFSLLLAVAACVKPTLLAQSEDGSIRVTDRMARQAFQTFCDSPEAQDRCDRFDQYEIHAGSLTEGIVGAEFILRDRPVHRPGVVPKLQGFGCMWMSDGVECHSGDHAYD